MYKKQNLLSHFDRHAEQVREHIAELWESDTDEKGHFTAFLSPHVPKFRTGLTRGCDTSVLVKDVSEALSEYYHTVYGAPGGEIVFIPNIQIVQDFGDGKGLPALFLEVGGEWVHRA